jgi:hypothetical protein
VRRFFRRQEVDLLLLEDVTEERDWYCAEGARYRAALQGVVDAGYYTGGIAEAALAHLDWDPPVVFEDVLGEGV